MADATAGKFATVLFYRLDRMARTLELVLDAERRLTALNVGFQSASESYDTVTPTGRLVFHLLASLAEWEKNLILERTSIGRERIAREGKWTGGRLPLGYEVEAGRLVVSKRIVPELGITESALVVDIFERIAAGSSILAEVDRLNQLGVPSVEGKLWRTSRLSTLLHNPIYLGNHPYRTKTSETPRKAPPLVTKPLWDAVQVQLKRNLSRNHSKTRFNLLRGLIRCENCGSTFVGSTMGRHYYYRCSRTLPASEPDRSKRCKAGYLRADAVEALVWGECADLLQNPDMVLQLELDTLEELRARDANRAAEVRKLQEGLAERAAERDFVTRQARKGHLSKAEAETHLAEIRAQELPLHAELARFEDQKSLAAAHLQRIREAEAVLRELRAKTNLDDPEDRRKAVEALLQRMAVKTTGTGKDKKAQITLRWLGQEPFIVVNLKDLNHEVTPATLLDDLDDVVSSGSTL